MPNITWCDLPEDVSLWPGLPLSLSGDEVMPLDYHAGRSGWLLYGRGLDKQRLTQYQSKLGAAMVIVAAWCVEDYQVIRLAGSLTARATRLAHEAQLDVAPLGKIPHLRTPGLLVMDMDSTAIQIECIDEIAKLAGTGEMVAEVTERAMRGELDFTASLRSRVATLKGADANILQQVRENLPLMPGLTQLVLKLETLGWKVAIASGGFTFFAASIISSSSEKTSSRNKIGFLPVYFFNKSLMIRILPACSALEISTFFSIGITSATWYKDSLIMSCS